MYVQKSCTERSLIMAEMSFKERLLSMIKDVDEAQNTMHKDLGLDLMGKD